MQIAVAKRANNGHLQRGFFEVFHFTEMFNPECAHMFVDAVFNTNMTVSHPYWLVMHVRFTHTITTINASLFAFFTYVFNTIRTVLDVCINVLVMCISQN